jgi:hypothetical protein
MITVPTLKLVSESKIRDLLPRDQPTKRFEASGVLAKERHYFVVFDDRAEVARLSDDLQPNTTNGLYGIGMTHTDYGFEGITYNAAKHRFYLLVEAREHANGCYKASIVEYDDGFNYLKERPVDFTFKSSNKGFEAMVFVDYSGMSIDNRRVAIVSQVNSMLWVGQFDDDNWTWRNAGQLYEFPRSTNGSIQYGNIEGVGWVTPSRIVAVSDRRKKKDQPDKQLSEKDQSVHIFDIP